MNNNVSTNLMQSLDEQQFTQDIEEQQQILEIRLLIEEREDIISDLLSNQVIDEEYSKERLGEIRSKINAQPFWMVKTAESNSIGSILSWLNWDIYMYGIVFESDSIIENGEEEDIPQNLETLLA
jgi:hypothetical protein